MRHRSSKNKEDKVFSVLEFENAGISVINAGLILGLDASTDVDCVCPFVCSPQHAAWFWV